MSDLVRRATAPDRPAVLATVVAAFADDAGSVALWDAPGNPSPTARDAAWSAFDAQAGEGVQERLAAYDAAHGGAAPSSPNWYLGVLATRPDAAGRGGATRVMAPGLALADAQGRARPAGRSAYVVAAASSRRMRARSW